MKVTKNVPTVMKSFTSLVGLKLTLYTCTEYLHGHQILVTTLSMTMIQRLTIFHKSLPVAGRAETGKLNRPWHFKCNICSTVTDSQALPNKHYCKNHPPLKCSDCEQIFNNPCSLCRHKYSHLELKFLCRSCGHHFLFESDLVNHCLKHRIYTGHQCNHHSEGKVCGKCFFAKSDLSKHAPIHSGKIHSCLECDYAAYDIRYLRAHRYTHSDREKYECTKCKKWFKHHTQLKCHSEKCS